MPSLFDALGSAAAGYTNEFNQTRQFNEQKRLDDAQVERQNVLDQQAQQTFKEQQEDRLRNRGIDPVTGHPFLLPKNLQQVVPNNKGIAPIDPLTHKPYVGGASPQQQLDYAYARAQNAAQNGDMVDYQSWLDRAKGIDASIKEAIQQQHYMEMYNAAMYGHDVSRENNLNTVAGADTRNIRTTDTSRANTFDRDLTSTQNNIRTTDTSRANTAAHIATQLTAQSENDIRAMAQQNAVAERDGKTQPYPNLEAAQRNLASAIATVAEHPEQLEKYLKGLDAHAADYGAPFLIYAKRQLQNAAQGGSQAKGPFLGKPPGPNPPPYPNP